jgi:CheY-like chemotaxis protein/anti-sigma regulatory factor (Ser/Thr protein kinase)
VVRSDPLLVELVLRNLVSNAIRYASAGGVLVVCRSRGTETVLEVWDTGIGIAASQHQEIFREFHQLGNPERDRNKGLGLGLSIVDGLVKVLNCRLTLCSRPGRGSVFKVWLPTAEPHQEPDRLSPQPAPVGEHRLDLRVLVIDDDEAVRTGMQQLLRTWGCEGVAAESIEEALALCATFRPDVVICDYRLRELRTGAEAIALLRQQLGAGLPALLVTGDTAPDRIREARSSGVPILHKPVPPQVLYQALVALVPSHTAMPGAHWGEGA